MKRNLQELWLRLRGETPTHFKRIIYGGITVGVTCGAILALPITLPAVIVTVLGYGVTIGAVSTAVASTALKNPEDVLKDLNKKDQ